MLPFFYILAHFDMDHLLHHVLPAMRDSSETTSPNNSFLNCFCGSWIVVHNSKKNHEYRAFYCAVGERIVDTTLAQMVRYRRQDFSNIWKCYRQIHRRPHRGRTGSRWTHLGLDIEVGIWAMTRTVLKWLWGRQVATRSLGHLMLMASQNQLHRSHPPRLWFSLSMKNRGIHVSRKHFRLF